MKSPLQALIDSGAVPSVSFPTNSRYYGSHTFTHVMPCGRVVAYLERRIVPQAGSPNFSTIARHTVHQGDRLDLLAAKYLGDPLLFWLICDANGAMDPDKLVETPETVLNISMPQGVPGESNAR